ncbi:facilitated trehalose transporter Tret1-like isoform X2 [Anthonomus grandis grandis]|uniref:facilitated trehalose transporter Tret1-like isoform X2 n=1 Tax=Anthonomus grandis grandis TaxID=2921223 RepID=UPI0021658CB9|nr:facilitated trehalose transporter Tret1-like isoform X2 [Anthonomus grandis grandis]
MTVQINIVARIFNNKDLTQILAIIIAGLAPITTGILYAWSSPSILQIQKDNVTYHITDEETSYFPILPPLGSYLSVRKTAIVCSALPILFVLLFIQMPESPYYLIQKQKLDKAQKSLRWLREEDVNEEFQKMQADVARQISESGTWKDLFIIGSNRRALLAGVFLRFSQLLGGISAFATNTQPIFQKAGGDFNPQLCSIIFLGLCFVLNFFGSAVVAKLGRKKSYIYSPLGCGLSLLTLSIYFILDEHTTIDLSKFGMLPLVGMIIYMIFFSFGMGVVPTLMLSELFSASIKGKALCIMNMVFGTALFVSNFIFKLMDSYIGLYAPFLVFAISCLLTSVLSIYVVPETKGKTLEEIQQSLKSKSKPEIKSEKFNKIDLP